MNRIAKTIAGLAATLGVWGLHGADVTASAAAEGVKIDTRATDAVRTLASADEALPVAGDPTWGGAAGGAYTVTATHGAEVETLIAAETAQVADWTPKPGVTTLAYRDAEDHVLTAVFTRASAPLGDLGGVTISGAEAPKVGRPLTAAVAGVDDPGALAYLWQRGTAAYGTGVFTYGPVLSTAAAYTPTADDYETMIRVIATDGVTAATNSVYFSRLPVIYIDGTVPTAKAQGYTEANLRLQGGERFSSGLYDGVTQIKIRGNSTANMPKKPYKLKLDTKTNLLGLGTKANKHWVLLANYLDQSLMRNTAAYRFSQNFGMVNMKTEWVDVVVNGVYQGNYQLCQHIRIADDRVNIFDWEDEGETVGKAALKDKTAKAALAAIGVTDKGDFGENFSWVNTGIFTNDKGSADVSGIKGVFGNDITGGYLFEFSHEYDEVSKFTTKGGLKAMLNKPEFLYTNPDMMAFCSNYLERCEAAWKSADGVNADGEHYADLVNVDSLVGFWLVNEVFGNQDAVYKSRYAWMDRGGSLNFGPVWDFDWGAGSISVGTVATGWKVAQYADKVGFYKEWLDDPWFCQKAQAAYQAVRGDLAALVADGGTLDGYRAYLEESGAAESNRWYKTQSASYGANVRGFGKDAAMFKTYMTERLAWLDKQFANLETLMASVRTTASASPYTRDAARLAVGVADGSDAATADGLHVAAYGAGAALTVEAKGAARVKMFIDGAEAGAVEGASGTVTVPAAAYADGAALVSFVSYGANGAVVARNYVTVEKALHGWEADVPDADGAATVSRNGIAVDTRTAAGETRVLKRRGDGEEILPFALSGDFARRGGDAAPYRVTLATAGGAADWASGTGETVQDWTPAAAGENTFTLTAADGGTLTATFAVRVAFLSDGSADDLEPAADGAATVTVRRSGVALDTRTAAGETRAIAADGDWLPFALSGDFARRGGEAAYRVTLANADGAADWASGTGETVQNWTPETAGENTFTRTAADGVLTATFDVSVAVASGGKAGEIGGGADGATQEVVLKRDAVALDTRTAAGETREVWTADDVLPLVASAGGFASADGAGRWRIDWAAAGLSLKVAAGAGEATVAWTPPREGTNVLTHTAADGSVLRAVFAVAAAAAAQTAFNEGEIADGAGATAEVTVLLTGRTLDTRTADGTAHVVATQDELERILPFTYSADAWGAADGAAATLTGTKDGGRTVALVAAADDDGTVAWAPAAAGSYVFVHTAGGRTETAVFTVGEGLAYPGAGALDERGGLTWLYVSADPADAGEWGYADAAAYAAWPAAVREAQTGDFTGVEVAGETLRLTFRARFSEAAAATGEGLRAWAEASVASGKIAVMRSAAPGGAETAADISVEAADALTVTLATPLEDGAGFYRLVIED